MGKFVDRWLGSLFSSRITGTNTKLKTFLQFYLSMTILTNRLYIDDNLLIRVFELCEKVKKWRFYRKIYEFDGSNFLLASRKEAGLVLSGE